MSSTRSTNLQAVTSQTAPAQRSPDPVVAALTGAMSKMKTVLPAHITPEKMARLAMGELRTNRQLAKIAQANPASLVSALMKASQAGLEIGGIKGHGYLVPYGNEITFLPGYRGLIQLARQSGQVTSIGVHIVYEHDVFDMTLGINEDISHKPKLDGDRGEPKLVYGVARFSDGSHHFDWMSMADVERIAAGTQSKGKSGPWKDHRPEMIRKTMARRLTKFLPLSSDRLEAAIAASDAFDGGQTIDVDFSVVDDRQALGNDPSTNADFGGGADGSQAETVSRETGEITGAAIAPAPAAAASNEPTFTYAEILDGINKAENVDALNEAASLISACGGGKKQQVELQQAYEAKHTALVG